MFMQKWIWLNLAKERDLYINLYLAICTYQPIILRSTRAMCIRHRACMGEWEWVFTLISTFFPLKSEKVKITRIIPTVILYICVSQWAHQTHHMSLITISALTVMHAHTHTKGERLTKPFKLQIYFVFNKCTNRCVEALLSVCVWSVHFLFSLF